VTQTRQKLSAAERRRHLLETASRVFADGTFRGTTTAEIARAVGCSEPILYRHFPSKRDLYFACIDHAWTELRRFIRRHLKDVHAFLARMLSHGQQLGIIHPDRDPEVEAWLTISGVTFSAMGERLGGLMDDVLPRIREQRRAWIMP
jgi:AcrR family transcriptional regulator